MKEQWRKYLKIIKEKERRNDTKEGKKKNEKVK